MNKKSHENKICVICEICVTKKRPKKNLCISVKSVGLFSTSEGICNDRTGRICEICVTKNRSTQMILPDFILFIWSFHYLIIPLQASIKWYTF